MKTLPKILLIGGAAVGALSLMSFKKVTDLVDHAKQLTGRFRTISKVKMSFPQLEFNLHIWVDNPTDVDFSVNGFGLVTLKTVRILDGMGNEVASTDLNIGSLEILAGESIKIDNIPVKGDITAALQLMAQLQSGNTNYEIVPFFAAMGTTF